MHWSCRVDIRKIFMAILVIGWCRNNFADGTARTNGKWKTTPEDQSEAVRGLLKRLIPQKAHFFNIQIDFLFGTNGKDSFKIETSDGKILVTGNRGYSAAFGVQYYLKKYCACHISWSGNQLHLPSVLPTLLRPVWKTAKDKFRYYMNPCTFSYSSVWWNWTRWEKEIDWMALNGINLPLAHTGQEALWKEVYKSFGLSNKDLDEYFTGPYFLAWNRMGNLQAWAAPLSDAWMRQKRILQGQILQRMRSFGMMPVLPAFNGRIPLAMMRRFPNTSVSFSSTKWGHFDHHYTPLAFVEPFDPLFHKIATTFLSTYIREFGTDHIYNADLFNEVIPSSNRSSYVATCAQSVYNSLRTVDQKAIWLIQGWMFYKDKAFWSHRRSQAFLTAVPLNSLIVLDLQAELFPQYRRLKSFFGQPFIWCMLHNYGGVTGLYGSIPRINQGVFEGRTFPESTMIGTGIAPEGIETNDVVYELMNELAWREDPVHLNQWISDFSKQRYGFESFEIKLAWIHLLRSVYNANIPFRNHGKYILTSRPSLNLKPYVWYNITDVFEAWKLFCQVTHNGTVTASNLFRHDLVDITRQGLQLIFDKNYQKLCSSYHDKDTQLFRKISSSLLEILDDADKLLATDDHFLLGIWIKGAKYMATTTSEMEQYSYNALNQISLWGPTGQILDYANKQWSGVMTNYFRKRWQLFTKMLDLCLAGSKFFNQTEYDEKVLNTVEIPFTLKYGEYPDIPFGDSVRIAQHLLQKYIQVTK